MIEQLAELAVSKFHKALVESAAHGVVVFERFNPMGANWDQTNAKLEAGESLDVLPVSGDPALMDKAQTVFPLERPEDVYGIINNHGHVKFAYINGNPIDKEVYIRSIR